MTVLDLFGDPLCFPIDRREIVPRKVFTWDSAIAALLATRFRSCPSTELLVDELTIALCPSRCPDPFDINGYRGLIRNLSAVLELLDPLSDPVENAEQHTEMVCRLQGGGFNIGRRIRRWMEVRLRRSGLGVSIPATLPGVVISCLERVNSVVATLEPPNVEAYLRNR